jgi:hypothetical protein
MAIRSVFTVLGDNERAMRSAEEESPDVTELKAFVWVVPDIVSCRKQKQRK